MIHETIRKKRRELEMSQKELAKKVGINVKSINQFEQGKQGLRKKNMDKIFKILNIEL